EETVNVAGSTSTTGRAASCSTMRDEIGHCSQVGCSKVTELTPVAWESSFPRDTIFVGYSQSSVPAGPGMYFQPNTIDGPLFAFASSSISIGVMPVTSPLRSRVLYSK